MSPDTICTLSSSCEEARQIDETRYEGRVRARLGPVTIRARVSGGVLEKHEPHAMRIALQGETAGMPGRFSGVAHVNMEEQAGRTHGQYTFEMEMLGRLGALGRPFFQMTAQHMANSFAGKMSKYLNEQR